jgi:hypothetical protein
MWRKQAGALPRLLFRPGQAVVDLPPAPPEEGFRSPEGAFVGFRTTAGEVLATLDESGLGCVGRGVRRDPVHRLQRRDDHGRGLGAGRGRHGG